MSVKNNKYFRRLAAALVTGAMLVSTLGMTVSADSVTDNPNATNGIKIIKELDMSKAPGASVPAITYNYAITAGDPVASTDTTPAILSGVGTISNVEISFDSTMKIDNEKAVKEAPIDFSGVTFAAPGIYRYVITQTVKEDSVKVNGITEKTPTTLYLDLYVVNSNPDDPNGAYKIGHAVMHNSTAAPTIAGDNYNYATDTKVDRFTAEYQTYTLTLAKNLAGGAANLSDKFEFGITLNGGDAGETFKYSVAGGNEQTATLGTEFTVTLGDNDSVAISGIPSNLTYTITEKDSKGYTAKYVITKGSTSGTETTNTTIANENMTTANNGVLFTNTKNAVTPTGVIMNIVPYVVMVALAAGLAFLFLRRRKREF